jgi:hypothetical protein
VREIHIVEKLQEQKLIYLECTDRFIDNFIEVKKNIRNVLFSNKKKSSQNVCMLLINKKMPQQSKKSSSALQGSQAKC